MSHVYTLSLQISDLDIETATMELKELVEKLAPKYQDNMVAFLDFSGDEFDPEDPEEIAEKIKENVEDGQSVSNGT